MIKNYYLSFLLFCCAFSFGYGQCLTDDFDSGYGNWSGSGTYQNTTAGRTGSGTGFNTLNDRIVTNTTLTNPQILTLWLARSPSTANKTLSIEYSTLNAGPWTSARDISVGEVTTTHQEFTLNLNLTGVYYIRIIMSQRSGGSYYLDDIEVNCGASSPEIEVRGNGTEIIDGDITPNTSDDTDFGATAVAGGTVIRTFTILNSGGSDLTLSGTPNLVTVTPSAHFTITTQPAMSTIPHTGPTTSTTFQILFDPTGFGTHTATVTIENDDSDENPYNFDIEGIGSNSNTSDIIASSTFIYNENIDYTNYQIAPIFTTAQSIAAFRVEVQDGGASNNDSDTEPTELTAITFDVTNINNIRSAVLFAGNTRIDNNPTIVASSIGFSGISFSVTDDTTAFLTLRLTFLTTVMDNAQMQFTVSAATANSTGSIFGSINAGGATSSTAGDDNRIEVTADRLSFVQQPTDTNTNATMTDVRVRATDINTNTDFDWAQNIQITSTGTMTGSPLNVLAVNGLATFNNIVHTVEEANRQLNAERNGTLDWDTTSSLFDIKSLPLSNGDYRTIGSGTWTNNTIWERYTGGTWGASDAPATNTGNRLYIRNGHTINAGNFGNTALLYIQDGGTFNIGSSSTALEIYVYEGGNLNINANLSINSNGGVFEIFDGGNVVVNFRYSNPRTSLWDGTEIFHANSNFILEDWRDGVWFVPSNTAINTNTYSGYVAAFGNIILDFGSNLDSNDDFDILISGTTINLSHGDLIMRSNNALNSDIRLSTTGTVTSGIGGDFIIENGYFGQQQINMKTSGTLNFTIMGNMELNAATLRVASGANPLSTVNIEGDLIIAPSAVLDFNPTVSLSALVTLNLKGNLSVAASGLLRNSNSSVQGILNLNGTGDGLSVATTQTIDIASTNATENRNINFYALNDSYIQLINRDLELGRNGGFIVENGAVLDFGFNGATALNIGISDSETGTLFSSQLGSTLKVTSPNGITSTANLGNVQVTPSNRNYNQTANFYYIGNQNQVTGNALTVGSTVKNVYVILGNNNLELRLTNRTGIADGGKLEIQQGIVIGEEAGPLDIDDLDFYGGDGQLVMTGGEYRISTITANPLNPINGYLPKLRKYGSYVLSGGTIHLNGSNETQLLSGTPNYFNLSFSGSNVLATLPPLPPNIPNYKGISNGTSVSGTITISKDAIVDVKNWTLGGNNTNLVMKDNSRFIMAGASTKPDATGNYTLGENTSIEFNNDLTGSLESIRLTNPVPNYANIVISGSNVGTTALGTGANSFIQFQPNGSFTITGDGIFKQSNSFGFSGAANTSIISANNPGIILLDNSTVEYAGADQVITSLTTTEYKNVTLSGTGIKSLGHPTDILVGEDLNIVAAAIIINTDEVITVDEGLVITGGNMTIEDSGSLVQINETNTNSGNIAMKRNAFIENYDYVYWSAPVSGFNTNNLFQSTSSNIFYWDPIASNIPFGGSGQGYWIDASNQQMITCKGYIARSPNYSSITQDETLFENGAPNNGTITVFLERGNDNDGLGDDDDDDDWNLIGNPYPSSISLVDFLAPNTNIDGFINLWTHGAPPADTQPDPFYENNNGFNYDPNDYITANSTANTCSPNDNTVCFDGFIAASQGYMVNTIDGLQSTVIDITFTNSMRSKDYDNSNFFRLNNSENNDDISLDEEKHRIWLDLASENNGVDRIVLGYVTNATMGRDRLYDAISSNKGDSQNFYSIIDAKPFVIQGRSIPFSDNDKVPLGFNSVAVDNYTIAINAVDGLFNDQTVYLKDNALNFIHDLTNSPYTFTSYIGEFNDRFEIVFRADALFISDRTLDSNDLKITELSNGNVEFRIGRNYTITNVKILEITGRLVYDLKGNNSSEVYNLSQLSIAAYIARVTLSNGQVISKKAIKKH